MMEEQPQAVSAVESEDTGLAEALQQLNEKIRDSNDESRASNISLTGNITSLDDFLGGRTQ